MFKKLINFGHSKLALLDEHTLEVVKKSFSSTIVKVAGMIIGLGVSVFLGRTIGADGLGIINLSNRVVNILLVVGLLGMRQVIIKEVAIAHNKKDYAHIGNVMHTAYWLNGAFTLTLSVIFIFLSPWLANTVFNEPRLQYPLMIALVAMIPQVFSRIFSSGLIGYRKIWQSNLVEQTLSIAITGIILVILWLLKKDIAVNIVAVCYAIGRIGVTISVGFYWKSLYRFKSKRNIISKQLLKTSIPLLIITITSILESNADVIILGALADVKQVGLYTVAARIALLASFFLQVTNASVNPKIASLYETGKTKELEKMAQSVTKGLGIIGFFLLIIFIFLGKTILSIWGAEFMTGYWILLVLGFAQFINITTGAVGGLLIMTGHEKYHRNISIVMLVIGLILYIPFVYFYGAIGAAIVTATIIVSENILKLLFVRTKLNINVILLLKMKK